MDIMREVESNWAVTLADKLGEYRKAAFAFAVTSEGLEAIRADRARSDAGKAVFAALEGLANSTRARARYAMELARSDARSGL